MGGHVVTLLHIRISKSAYLHGQPLPLGHFSLCPSGHCHLPSGSIPLYYRPPSIPHLNNSSPATPGPLRYCRHTHKQPQTARAFINRWREKERERLVRGGKLFQNSRTGLRLRTPHHSGSSSSSVQVSLWADSILHCNRPPGSTTFLPPFLPFLSLHCSLHLSVADNTFSHFPAACTRYSLY